MFNCAQCHASTPDECARRHAAQLALHRSMEFQRGVMHQAIDAAAGKMIAVSSEPSNAAMSDSEIKLCILSPELTAAARRMTSIVREIEVMIRAWKE